MKEITMQECWSELLDQNITNIDETAEAMLGVVTGGMWAMWDGEKIDRMKAELINKFNKEIVQWNIKKVIIIVIYVVNKAVSMMALYLEQVKTLQKSVYVLNV